MKSRLPFHNSQLFVSRSNLGQSMAGLYTNQIIYKGEVICNYSGILNGPLDEDKVYEIDNLNLVSYQQL